MNLPSSHVEDVIKHTIKFIGGINSSYQIQNLSVDFYDVNIFTLKVNLEELHPFLGIISVFLTK